MFPAGVDVGGLYAYNMVHLGGMFFDFSKYGDNFSPLYMNIFRCVLCQLIVLVSIM